MLQQLVGDRLLHARNGTAFAVTPALRESYAEGDDDELAEVALREAALASLRLLAAEEADSGGQERSDRGSDTELPLRRAVLVADVEGGTIRRDLVDAVARVAGPARARR